MKGHDLSLNLGCCNMIVLKVSGLGLVLMGCDHSAVLKDSAFGIFLIGFNGGLVHKVCSLDVGREGNDTYLGLWS